LQAATVIFDRRLSLGQRSPRTFICANNSPALISECMRISVACMSRATTPVAWKGGTMTDGVPLALVESAKMPPGYIQFLLKTDFVLSGAGELARGYKF
jgi:hypothetical protein